MSASAFQRKGPARWSRNSSRNLQVADCRSLGAGRPTCNVLSQTSSLVAVPAALCLCTFEPPLARPFPACAQSPGQIGPKPAKTGQKWPCNFALRPSPFGTPLSGSQPSTLNPQLPCGSAPQYLVLGVQKWPEVHLGAVQSVLYRQKMPFPGQAMVKFLARRKPSPFVETLPLLVEPPPPAPLDHCDLALNQFPGAREKAVPNRAKKCQKVPKSAIQLRTSDFGLRNSAFWLSTLNPQLPCGSAPQYLVLGVQKWPEVHLGALQPVLYRQKMPFPGQATVKCLARCEPSPSVGTFSSVGSRAMPLR